MAGKIFVLHGVNEFTELTPIWWGEGKDRGGFAPMYIGKERHQICSVYNWYKRTFVEIYFQYMKPPFTDAEYRVKMKNAEDIKISETSGK
jgi:hypothetical protein